MTTLEHLKNICRLLDHPNPESLKMSMADTHHKGIFSLVIDGTLPGTLTRAFISSVKLKPFEIQLHSHRYPIRLTVIKGNVRHYDAHVNPSGISISKFDYKSPLNGGTGLSYSREVLVDIKDYALPVGSIISMDENDIHTVSCSKGSIWIVEELGFKTYNSTVLGVPFITEGLYNSPGQFQINDNFQILHQELKALISSYDLVK
ncbi:hypothetical protein CMU39_09195 [Elizabethkingia anophelis]|nr:hypothetical protein [Elizabethkingia anophelis]